LFFLVFTLIGVWLMYKALVNTARLKTQERNFLLAVTHELKTPLASLRLGLDTLQSPKIPDQKKAALVPIMKEDTLRLEGIVENVLEAARLDQPRYYEDRATLDFTALVEQSIQNLERSPSDVPRHIDTDLDSGLMIDGDEDSLRRAVAAILENANKYHDENSIHVSVSLRSNDNDLILTIADRGIGFESSDREAIFDRFFRVGDEITRKRPGTGLGLYLAREIVRAHGGSVKAGSDGPGKGAVFTVRLKRATP
jgi:signal transduction histidine kinase